MEQNFKIAVPEGCTASVEKKDNFVIVTFEPKEWEPKDGDVIAFGTRGIGIFKEYGVYGHIDYVTYSSELRFNESGWRNDNMRPATEEEKQRLFDALAKKGKRWNAEEKRIEDLPRWRAEKSSLYYYITNLSTVAHTSEDFLCTDDNLYNFGNYFKTREAAEKVAEQIREIFKNSKSE